jgi:hypothetical protein
VFISRYCAAIGEAGCRNACVPGGIVKGLLAQPVNKPAVNTKANKRRAAQWHCGMGGP